MVGCVDLVSCWVAVWLLLCCFAVTFVLILDSLLLVIGYWLWCCGCACAFRLVCLTCGLFVLSAGLFWGIRVLLGLCCFCWLFVLGFATALIVLLLFVVGLCIVGICVILCRWVVGVVVFGGVVLFFGRLGYTYFDYLFG